MSAVPAEDHRMKTVRTMFWFNVIMMTLAILPAHGHRQTTADSGTRTTGKVQVFFRLFIV